MKVSGTAFLHAPPEKVYTVLNDPAVLVRTLPGCETLALVGPDTYQATITAGVASIMGSYSGQVRLSDQQPPRSLVLHASGAGVPGTVSADIRVALADEGNGVTLLSYDAEAIVGGMIGGVGQRILSGVAKKTAAEFFAAVDAVLTGAEPEAAPPPDEATPGTAGAAETGGTATNATPAVFTRPTASSAPVGGQLSGGGFTLGLAAGAGIALLGALVGSLLPGGGFTLGVAVGAGIALLGALVGGLVAGRAARRR